MKKNLLYMLMVGVLIFQYACKKNDGADGPPVISKIRHHRLPVGASLLIRMHEISGMSIRDLRDLLGDRRTKYRVSDALGKLKAENNKQQEEKSAA